MSLEPVAPISLERWRRRGECYTHRGHAVFYRRGGPWESHRPVLLLLHGFPSASWIWTFLWEGLCREDRVLSPDLMGFGFSAKPPDYDYSIPDQADLCLGLGRELGVRRWHVLAHDYGATVAQELLARQGERGTEDPSPRIESLCLLNAGLFPEAHRPLLTQRLVAGRTGRVLFRLMTRRFFGRGLSTVFGPETKPAPEIVDAIWRLIGENRGRRVMHALMHFMEDRRRHRERWVGALREAGVPVRFVAGTADPVSGAHMVERYRELMPDPDVVALPRVGHYPHLEAPGRVLEAYREFRRSR